MKRNLWGRGMGLLLAGILLTGGMAACTKGANVRDNKVATLDEVEKGNVSYGISCHDPQIICADGRYVMSGSHQVIAVSPDLSSWECVANGNNMFTNIFKGDMPAFSFVGKNEQGGYSIWAPHIIYNDVMKKYVMYFCTSSTYMRSNLCMATSDVPEGPYTFESAFLHSGFTEDEADGVLGDVLGDGSDVSRYLGYGAYDNKKWPNCIDPAIFDGPDGRQWMVYGSWSGGLFVLEMDPSTGLPIHTDASVTEADPYFGYHLIGGGHHSIEGPSITYNPDTGYYYLFASFGWLEREGGYQIRQFRSETPTGPFVDYAGKTVNDEEDYFNYGLKMAGNYNLPSLETAYMAPGGQSFFIGADGEPYLTYHQRFDGGTEYHEPRVHRLFMNAEGWYVMAPFETGTEDVPEEGYRMEDVSGTYYFLDHGLDVGATIHDASACDFLDGNITGLEEGYTYELTEGTNQIRLKKGDIVYEGVVFDMTDEAGNPVRCISASGNDNHTIWVVQYRR